MSNFMPQRVDLFAQGIVEEVELRTEPLDPRKFRSRQKRADSGVYLIVHSSVSCFAYDLTTGASQ